MMPALALRPAIEVLEDRATPSITLPAPGGVAVLTGTPGPDHFVLRLAPGNPTLLQLSDDGGGRFASAALDTLGGIRVHGLEGADTLTLDHRHGMVGKADPAGLPITFEGGPGPDLLVAIRPSGERQEVAVDTVTIHTDVDQQTMGLLSPEESGAEAGEREAAGARFIARLYERSLGRSAAPPEVAYWQGVLRDAGREAVVRGIDHSFEAQARQVTRWYRELLGRAVAPSSPEIRGWVQGLVRGVAEEEVLQGILTSPEFLRRSQQAAPGANEDEQFIRGLYRVLLRREARGEELRWWMDVLPAAGRSGAVQAFLHAPEYRARVVQTYYQDLLGRPADAAGLHFWSVMPLRLQDIRATIAASDEFLRR